MRALKDEELGVELDKGILEREEASWEAGNMIGRAGEGNYGKSISVHCFDRTNAWLRD